MVVKIKSFDKSGKPFGPALIIWEGEVCFAEIIDEANGGKTIHMAKEDEFGNETKVTLNLDKVDIEQLNFI